MSGWCWLEHVHKIFPEKIWGNCGVSQNVFIPIVMHSHGDTQNTQNHGKILSSQNQSLNSSIIFLNAGGAPRSPALRASPDLSCHCPWSESLGCAGNVVFCFPSSTGDTLWGTYKKLLKMAIEIVDFPMKNGGSFHSKMLVHQRVHGDTGYPMDGWFLGQISIGWSRGMNLCHFRHFSSGKSMWKSC